MNNCKNCGNAIFDPVFGDYKCYVKQRGCSDGEMKNGCSDWGEKRAVKTETKEVRVDGATFTPSVSADGVLSWTNDQNLKNPEPVNIKGPKGDRGEPGVAGKDGAPGRDGVDGKDGKDGKDGAQGPKGEPGEKGETGEKGEKGDQGEPGPAGKDAEGSAAIIDVVELPTEDAQMGAIYRVLTGAFIVNGDLLYSNPCYCVSELPDVGEPGFNTDDDTITGYYSASDGNVYGYADENLASLFDVEQGWHPITLFTEYGFDSFDGVITNASDSLQDNLWRLLLSTTSYMYTGYWTVLSKKNIDINATGAETFNDTVGNTASGAFSHAEGYGTTASGYASHAEGESATASGYASHAEGGYTTASGYASHAEGSRTTASRNASHAEGDDTTASGYASHAEGSRTTASGDYSHAEGNDTTASGERSHAEGESVTASGRGSHAEGKDTTASSLASHAEGYGTIAGGDCQHVQGKWNIEDTEGKYAHIVGNGTWENRSNAHTLDWDGNAWYAGSVEATAIILKSPNGTRFRITVDDNGSLTATKEG